MKKLHIAWPWLRNAAFAALITCFFTAPVSAQYNPPVAWEAPFPFSPNIALTAHTSAYSFTPINPSGWGMVDLVLAGWDDAGGATAGMSWQYLMPGTPSTVFTSGVFPYPGCRDIEVGWVDAGGDPEIVVAYYQIGVGHMLDVYSMSTGVPVLSYTNTLSTSLTYGRISLDSHQPPYAVAVIWEEAGNLKTICGNTTAWGVITYSNILTITGTAGETVPDLVFNHTGNLWLQCVSYNPFTGNFTEFQYDYWVAMATAGTATTTIAPAVNDINFVGRCNPNNPPGGNPPTNPGNPNNPPPFAKVCPYPNIDAPSHYMVNNWAYTYTTDNNNISVRLRDWNTATLATVVVNNGTWGGTPINGNLNRYPFCYYNKKDCGNVGIITAWHTNAIDPMTGAGAGYIGVNMTENGGARLSAWSFLTVAGNPALASPTPVLSISKCDDQVPYMYTVFPEFDPILGQFQLENKYPPTCVNSFKGEGTEESHETECNDDAQRKAFIASLNLQKAKGLNVYPNPAEGSFGLSMPAAYQREEMTVVITNIVGETTGKYKGQASKVNAYLGELSKTMIGGTYILNVKVAGTNETLKLVKVK